MNAERLQPIPTHKGLPLLGVLPKLISQDPFEYLKNVMLDQGDLVRLDFVARSVYLASHPDYLQHILRDNYQNYRKPDLFYNGAREIVGNGLVTSSGDLWLRQRRMIQPQLHRKQLASLFSEMREGISESLSRWETAAKNNTEIELGDKMAEIAIHVITRTLFGKETLSAAEITEVGHRAMRIIKHVGETLFTGMLPKWIPKPGEAEFHRDIKAMRQTVSRIITRGREEKEAAASLIQMLINSVDEDTRQEMTEQQLFDEIMTIFLAGYETTATALTWLAVVLKDHPEVLEKLQAEVDQVLGASEPSFEGVTRLAYTRKVFLEVMRMYTIVPFLPRVLNQADQLGNHHLPANALVLVFYHGVHHNPRVWKDPEVFDPERFAPEHTASHHPFAYVPFSAGPRKCAGDEFALLEGPLMMAMILQKYNIHVIPNQTFPSRIGATMRPINGVKATLSIRNRQ